MKKLTMILIVVAIMTIILSPNFAEGASYDLRASWPNISKFKTHYLEGNNWVSGSPERSVLWFERGGIKRGSRGVPFVQHNWGPEDPQGDCNTDHLHWYRGLLKYYQTDNVCDGNDFVVNMSDGVTLMPRWWNGLYWNQAGTTPVVVERNGEEVCLGEMAWTAEVIGFEDLQPGRPTIHVRTTQVTEWLEGSDPSGCAAGFITEWQEDYWLDNKAGMIARSKGGNLNGDDNWDVWFTHWQELP